MKPETYTKKAAIKQVKIMRFAGWPKAHAARRDNGLYIISTHARSCTCGRCPIVRIDGYVN